MANANSLVRLRKYISRTAWADAFSEVYAEHIESALDEFGLEPAQILEILGEHAALNLYGCAFEDFLSRTYDDGCNVVDEYLKRRGYTESPGDKRYMKALRGSALSLYEVSDIVPGVSFLARDLLREGDPVRVLEVSGSKMLSPWDRIAARIIVEGDSHRMAGGVLRFDWETSELLLATITTLQGQGPEELRALLLDGVSGEDEAEIDALLRDAARAPEIIAPAISNIWLKDTLERVLRPKRPNYVTSEGDPVVLCTSTFAFQDGTTASACRKALDNVERLVRCGTGFDWIADERATPKPATKHKDNTLILSTTTEDGAVVLGGIACKKKSLVLTTQSKKRAKAGETMVARALGALVGAPLREEASVQDMLADSKAKPKPSRKPKTDVPQEIAGPILKTYYDDHYSKLLDEPIAIFGGVSPRDAVKSDEGRAQVVSWLKQAENRFTGNGSLESYDFGWMWRELGVSELRA